MDIQIPKKTRPITKNVTEALREYMVAEEDYKAKIDEYFPNIRLVPNEGIKQAKELTSEALSELYELAQKVDEKHKIWIKLAMRTTTKLERKE